jgi:hypothetical protein
MESLTDPVSVLGAADAPVVLLVAGVLAGICIWAAPSMGENVRNAIVFMAVRLAFICIPLFGLADVVLLLTQSLV